MVISFSSEKPRARLLAGERVFTTRRNRRKQFIGAFGRGIPDWANEKRGGPKIADVIIHEAGLIEARHLKSWVDFSGFETMEEWVDEIRRLNRWVDVRITDKLWLYMVQTRDAVFKPWKPG